MGKISFWLHNARHISLPQSLLPAVTAVCVGAGAPGRNFSWLAAVLAVLGTAFAHLGMNLLDDIFDYQVRSGETRKELAAEGIRARMVKYPYLTSGQATVKQLYGVTVLFLALAAAAGIAVAILQSWNMLWFMLLGFCIGFSYSGAPLKLGFRGWGELVIFLMFGPVLMTGICFAVSGEIPSRIIWISVAVGLLVTNIVYSHSVMDAEPDRKMGKMTLAHRMGSDHGKIIMSGIINLLPYLLVMAGVVFHQLHPAYLSVFLVLPLSVWLFYQMRDFVHGKMSQPIVRAWMGPMGDFGKYEQAGIAWFMLRWLVARNIVSFFCLILIVVSLILSVS